MSQDRSTYLTIFLHNNDDFNIHLEFLPLDSDVDGIWVRTTLTAITDSRHSSRGSWRRSSSAFWHWYAVSSGMTRKCPHLKYAILTAPSKRDSNQAQFVPALKWRSGSMVS